MAKRKKPRPGDELKVGSRVFYRMPGGLFEAVVVEDRGDIGMNGRRLLEIRPLSEYSEGEIVWPAEELLPAERLEPAERGLDEKRRVTRPKRSATGGIGVGSRVLYQVPWGTMRAEVVEDRGNVGWKGRRIMRILPVFEGEDGPDAFEVPLQDLTLDE
ncbi:MAG: hypothetical protein ACJ8GN_30545 [Longimicrobiaceae bacterium]